MECTEGVIAYSFLHRTPAERTTESFVWRRELDNVLWNIALGVGVHITCYGYEQHPIQGWLGAPKRYRSSYTFGGEGFKGEISDLELVDERFPILVNEKMTDERVVALREDLLEYFPGERFDERTMRGGIVGLEGVVYNIFTHNSLSRDIVPKIQNVFEKMYTPIIEECRIHKGNAGSKRLLDSFMYQDIDYLEKMRENNATSREVCEMEEMEK